MFAFSELIAEATAEARKRVAEERRRKVAPADWYSWLKTIFPEHFTHEFAQHHKELWDWIWKIESGKRPRPFVLILAREGGKSTNAEAAVVAVGARKTRGYAWFVSETQDQADAKVVNIADMLEAEQTGAYYPDLADREVGKFGSPRSWRRQRLRTRSGFIVDSVGLDTARRGMKVKEKRPDFIILDDIDGKHDKQNTR